ncbi:MAG: hypothetical protein KAQ96_03650, partial [Thermoplasmata archaeon]|nr:hypothetical protein [Thermoplasmata archaeon]
SLLSAVDHYRDYVRLKVAAVNDTDETITDVSIEVGYDEGSLNLDRVEPHTLQLIDNSVVLGNIKSGERKTTSFLFEPTTSEEAVIDGKLAYSDSQGESHSMDMKRRTMEPEP